MKKNAMILGSLLLVLTTGAQAQQKSAAPVLAQGSAKVRVDVAFKPVLSIKLGSGAVNRNAEGADVFHLSLKTFKNYTEKPGVNRRVNKQLEVFSIGSGYSVGATLKASNDRLYSVFRFGLGTTEYFTLYPASSAMQDLFTGPSEGFKELDASYAMNTVTADNAGVYNELIGKDGKAKTFTLDVTYTIAPN